MKEEFTAEEQAALAEMEADTGEGIEDVSTQEDTSDTGQQEAPEDAAHDEADTAKPEEAEQPAEVKDADAKAKPPEGYVPHQALHAEREARKALAAQLQELQAWKEAQEKPKEVAPEYADPLLDPEGHRKWAEYNQTTTQQAIQQFQEAQQRQIQEQQRLSAAQQAEQTFAQQTPDYYDAAKFMQQHRVSELRASGYSDADIGAQIRNDANALFDAAQKIGMNPAELLYLRAKQAGFAAPAPKVEQETQRMAAQSRAQASTQNLGNGGGAPQSGALTASQLAEMSESELAKVKPEDFRRAMGG